MQNKQVHHGLIFLMELNAFLTNLAVASIYRQTSGKIIIDGMYNSLWSWPKELMLNRKLRIYIISEKENPLRYTQIVKNLFCGKFPFHLIFMLKVQEFSVE